MSQNELKEESDLEKQSDYIAHLRQEDEREQSVYDHLSGVAELAQRFAQPFGAGEQAKWMGWAHDIGKYTQAFQRRIRDNGPKVDHATAGAKELMALGMPWAALGCAGHHGGIPDGGGPGDGADMPTLMGRCKRQVPDYRAYTQEVALTKAPPPPFSDPFEATFMVRMLYSCLVDADFLDTEAFMSGKPRGSCSGCWKRRRLPSGHSDVPRPPSKPTERDSPHAESCRSLPGERGLKPRCWQSRRLRRRSLPLTEGIRV